MMESDLWSKFEKRDVNKGIYRKYVFIKTLSQTKWQVSYTNAKIQIKIKTKGMIKTLVQLCATCLWAFTTYYNI